MTSSSEEAAWGVFLEDVAEAARPVGRLLAMQMSTTPDRAKAITKAQQYLAEAIKVLVVE